MSKLSTSLRSCSASLLSAIIGLFPLGYGVYLFSNEARMRSTLAVPAELPTVPVQTRQPLNDFNPGAIATVMGLAAPDAAVRSTEPLTLRASFVSNNGLSRALLAGTEGEQLYQVGDSLPGGSVLRRVEMARVVLWRNGREELVALYPTIEHPFLTLSHTDTQPASAPLPIHLQPSAELPQSH